MAAGWIKMRIELQSHPKVVRIMSATASDKFRVIGGLHAVWGVFDQHSEDGKLYGYTPDLMDQIIGWTGFSAAMIAVGWLHYDGEEVLQMPDFDEHQSQSAKRRAEDQKRKRSSRSCPQNVRSESASEADEKRTREEKNIKDIKQTREPKKSKTSLPADFDISDAVRTWAEKNGHDRLDQHLAHFINAAKANDYKYADWDAAFRNAISGNWAKLSTTTPASVRSIFAGAR